MRRFVLPLLLGSAVLLSPIASRSSAPEPILREGLVLPLPGQLNTELMDPSIVKLIVGVRGYAAEMERKAILQRTAEGSAGGQAAGGRDHVGRGRIGLRRARRARA